MSGLLIRRRKPLLVGVCPVWIGENRGPGFLPGFVESM
ncbi:hypothetical protein IAE36_000255 [Pseudomonas sp. S36]|nr:hypothetical protein [Pseudomonas sp. S36]